MEITNCNKLIRKNKIVDDANDLTNGQFGINGYKDSCNFVITNGEDVIKKLEVIKIGRASCRERV